MTSVRREIISLSAYRTEQTKPAPDSWLNYWRPTVTPPALSILRNVKDILHLKSGLAYLGDNRLVVIEALANRQEFRGYELVRVNMDEEYAANCVRVNDYVPGSGWVSRV